MCWRLRPGLHHAVSGGTGIFLDVTTGRYFALDNDLDLTVRQALTADARSCDPQCLASLVEQAILVEAPGDQYAPACPVVPTHDGEGRGRARLGLVAKAGWARRRAQRDLRRRRLSEFEAELAQPTGDQIDPASLGSEPFDLAASFAQLGMLSAAQDQCLPDTIAFARLVRAAAIPVTVVFGVCAGPFAAHCWAQLGTLVLNDRLERTAMFTPILAW